MADHLMLEIQRAARLAKMPAPCRRVLDALIARCCGSHRGCFPSIATIGADVSGMGRREVQRALRALEDAGWLTVHRAPYQSTDYFPQVGQDIAPASRRGCTRPPAGPVPALRIKVLKDQEKDQRTPRRVQA